MTAFFAFTDASEKEFIIQLVDEQRIAEARRILSGEEKMSVHVMGRIMKTPMPYNPGWNFHLDPETISFFTQAIEVCDASIMYVQDHLDEACGAFLPGCMWCPWSSRLTREIIP
ncbi:calmodulin [Nocardia amamiensis]|uniref:Calmodulin n=1 Tax=Nocardia amamiensis TaxID=404578 RepID=A0ABS0CI62_9NOCA|nr:calmodulin [Nocardia amamiensis]MBF6295931.1 calmodulin [Nocardia amamiensis]